METAAKKSRFGLLDAFRGLCVISMVCYHAMYDLVYIKGVPVSWYGQAPGYLWQQSICWGFILLSGACWGFSRRHWQHGLLLVCCGAVVTLATYLVMPSELIQYGVLTLLGLSALLLIPLEKLFRKMKLSPAVGLVCAAALFFLTRNIPRGSLGFEGVQIAPLPAALYRSDVFAVLGFHSPAFTSSDYFPLLPWFFLYLAGFFLWQLVSRREDLLNALRPGLPWAFLQRPLAWVGRHSLLIYLLHQPLLFGISLLF